MKIKVDGKYVVKNRDDIEYVEIVWKSDESGLLFRNCGIFNFKPGSASFKTRSRWDDHGRNYDNDDLTIVGEYKEPEEKPLNMTEIDERVDSHLYSLSPAGKLNVCAFLRGLFTDLGIEWKEYDTYKPLFGNAYVGKNNNGIPMYYLMVTNSQDEYSLITMTGHYKALGRTGKEMTKYLKEKDIRNIGPASEILKRGMED